MKKRVFSLNNKDVILLFHTNLREKSPSLKNLNLNFLKIIKMQCFYFVFLFPLISPDINNGYI